MSYWKVFELRQATQAMRNRNGYGRLCARSVATLGNFLLGKHGGCPRVGYAVSIQIHCIDSVQRDSGTVSGGRLGLCCRHGGVFTRTW